MKAKFYISIFLLLFSLSITGQSKYYYYHKGEKKYLFLDKSSADISVKNTLNKSSLKNNYKLRDFNLEDDNFSSKSSAYKYAKITFQKEPTETEYLKKLKLIKSRSDVHTICPNFKGNNGEKIGMSDYLYVKLKNSNDYKTLSSLASQKKVSIIEQNKFMPLWYTLRCTENTTENTLEVANYFFETGLFASAVPDLLTYNDIVCTNDTNFKDLWGLNNTSNQNIDINACDAWLITEGSGVNVAVLDQGIELTHNDLSYNTSSSSYDTESNSSPSKIFGDHGVHCAGIIGAIKDNNLQVVGVAPKSTLFSISNSLGGNANSRIKRADGINWAVQNGVEIINNSWRSGVQYDPIDDAIDNALTNGRNGLGTILVFAAGNGFGSPINYPANYHPNILAVGSITSSGSKSNFSNRGKELDIVAPGSSILSTGLNNSITTKSGTSMAAPHVAGIAALILSVNPNLTAKEVNTIIESTAQKVGNYSYTNNSNRPNGTWNNEMGYGLVDAHAAVQKAQQLCEAKLESVDAICHNKFKSINLSNSCNSSVAWSVTRSILIKSKDNTKIRILAKKGSDWGAVRATLSNGKVLTETFKILAPPVIKFTNTSLTESLLNPDDSNIRVNNAAVSLRDGGRIPFTLEGATSVQWKNARRASSPYPRLGGGYGGGSSSTTYVAVPYSGCYGSSGRHPNSLPSSQASRLLSYYFIQPSGWQAPGYSPPIKLLSGSGDVVEVELTATNACGCTTEVNHYKVSRTPPKSSPSDHSLTVSPNPATTSITIQVKAPRQSPTRRDNLAYLKACCEKSRSGSSSRYGGYGRYSDCCRQLGSYQPPGTSNKYEMFSYTLSIFHTSTGEERYKGGFLLFRGKSKTVALNVSRWPRGLYVVNVVTNEGHHITRTIVIK